MPHLLNRAPSLPRWAPWHRSAGDRDWRRDECLSAANSVLGQVMILERHLEHAVDLLGDQPFSDDPAWTYSSVGSAGTVEGVIDLVALTLLQEALNGVNE